MGYLAKNLYHFDKDNIRLELHLNNLEPFAKE